MLNEMNPTATSLRGTIFKEGSKQSFNLIGQKYQK